MPVIDASPLPSQCRTEDSGPSEIVYLVPQSKWKLIHARLRLRFKRFR